MSSLNYSVREMNYLDKDDVEAWLHIMEMSFGHRIDFGNNIISHPFYEVSATYFLLDSDKPIAGVSIATFQKNHDIGVTHYLGINPDYRNRGVGKYMILVALGKLVERGISKCEGESTLKYKKSIGIHFDFGFRPKYGRDHWNTPDNRSFLTKGLSTVAFIFFRWKYLWHRFRKEPFLS